MLKRRSIDDVPVKQTRSTKKKPGKVDKSALGYAIRELQEYANEAMNDHSWTSFPSLKRALELHPSSFPYCPVKTFYGMLQGSIAPVGETNFAMEYFTSVGTLVHTMIQTAMGMGGRVWGHWECSQKKLCGWSNLEELTTYQPCPKCGSHCTYEEIGYNIDGILVGHQDCLFELSDGSFWIVDYKTCMMYKAEKHAYDGVTLAGNNVYRAQQRTYTTLAHRKYGKSHGIKPKGWILMYMPRDNPFRPAFYGEEVTVEEKKEIWQRIHLDMELHTQILDATEFDEIEWVIENKPCQSLQHYKDYMESPYEECPLLSVCFNRKRLRATLKDEMEGHVLLPLRGTIHAMIEEQQIIYREISKAGQSDV